MIDTKDDKYIDKFLSDEEGLVIWNQRYKKIEKIMEEKNCQGSLTFITRGGNKYKLISDWNQCRAVGILFFNVNLPWKIIESIPNYFGLEININTISNSVIEIILKSKFQENNKFYMELFYELLNYLDLIDNDEKRFKEVFRWIKNKAKLFQIDKSNQISISKEKGLFGELSSMEYLVNNAGMTWKMILEAWIAPSYGVFDFDFPLFNFETKVSSNYSVIFHGVYQSKCFKETYLQTMELKEDIEGGITLSQKISDIKEKMTQQEVDVFEKLLSAYGYGENNNISGKGFVISNVRNYCMSDPEFPSYNISRAYSDVNLTLSLFEIEEFQITGEELVRMITGKIKEEVE